MATDATRSAASATASSARRMTASSEARATTSTTSRCPGMLHMRSCGARSRTHASRASTRRGRAALPGVVAVVTGELMAQHNLAWMPTMSGDTQAVLATDKVRFQGQEVAAVIAETAYVAKDAARADRRRLRAAAGGRDAAAGARVGRAGHPRRQGGPGRTTTSTTGRPATRKPPTGRSPKPTWWSRSTRSTRAAIRRRSRRARASPTSTRRPGKVTIYMTSQAPHAIRTVFALVTGLPEENIRIVSPDIGGGFGNKVPVYPGYVVARPRRC